MIVQVFKLGNTLIQAWAYARRTVTVSRHASCLGRAEINHKASGSARLGCRWAGPSPHLGSTLELTLLARTQVSWPWGCESRRVEPEPSPCPHAPIAIGREGSTPHLSKRVELALVAWRQVSWTGDPRVGKLVLFLCCLMSWERQPGKWWRTSLMEMMREIWQADQLSYHLGPEQGLTQLCCEVN